MACSPELFDWNMRAFLPGREDQYVPILIPHSCAVSDLMFLNYDPMRREECVVSMMEIVCGRVSKRKVNS